MDILSQFPSQYLKAQDFVQPQICTIRTVTSETVGQGTEAATKPVLYLMEKQQGLVLNKTNATTLAAGFGGNTELWTNQQIEIYSEQVNFQGRIVPALRVKQVALAAPQPVAPPPQPAAAPEQPQAVAAPAQPQSEAAAVPAAFDDDIGF